MRSLLRSGNALQLIGQVMRLSIALPQSRRYVRAVGFVVALIAPLAAVALAGMAFQTTMHWLDRTALKPSVEIYNVGDATLHLRCSGAGAPTIVLEAGATALAAVWAWIQGELAKTHRVCAYDRAGMGWSSWNAGKHDGVAAAERLHALLGAAKIPLPIILVGHSFGAPLAAIFSHRYPDSVAGLVLMDPLLPETLGQLPREAREAIQRFTALLGPASLLAKFGVLRATGVLAETGEGLPQSAYREVRMFASDPAHLRSSRAELEAWDLTMVEASRALGAMKHLPMAIISSGSWPMLERIDPGLTQLWRERTQTFIAMFSRAHHRVIPQATHYSILTNSEHAAQAANEIRLWAASQRTGIRGQR